MIRHRERTGKEKCPRCGVNRSDHHQRYCRKCYKSLYETKEGAAARRMELRGMA